jgi:hypothetical protein
MSRQSDPRKAAGWDSIRFSPGAFAVAVCDDGVGLPERLETSGFLLRSREPWLRTRTATAERRPPIDFRTWPMQSS